MRNINLIFPYLLFIHVLLFAAGADGEEVKIDGFLEIDKRFNISDELSEGDTLGKLRLQAKYNPVPDMFSLISLDLRYDDFPELETLPSVDEIESNYHTDTLLWEAYIELNQLIWSNFDLKIGKQRIAWGTADQFNPTDNLNPDDFTDFLDFGAKVPSLALKGTYYFGDYTITGVWLPIFEPALFPRGGTVSLLGKLPRRVEQPSETMGNGMYAAKFSGVAFNLDYSLSYFKGFDDIPIEFDNSFIPVMGFPEIEVIGFDFSGEFQSVGIWGEGAQFFPEEIKSGASTISSNDPYLKYTLGIDYTFSNGLYIEGQFIHGFFTERGKGNLHDYLMASVERKFLNDDLKLSLGGAFEKKDLENFKDGNGSGLFPEISYHPIDNLELTVGAYFFGGKTGTLLGNWDDFDLVFLKTKFSF